MTCCLQAESTMLNIHSSHASHVTRWPHHGASGPRRCPSALPHDRLAAIKLCPTPSACAPSTLFQPVTAMLSLKFTENTAAAKGSACLDEESIIMLSSLGVPSSRTCILHLMTMIIIIIVVALLEKLRLFTPPTPRRCGTDTLCPCILWMWPQLRTCNISR
jgi:hypothetical protein